MENARAAGKRKGREKLDVEEEGKKKQGEMTRWGDDEKEEMEAKEADVSDGEAMYGSSRDVSNSGTSACSGGSKEEKEKQRKRRHAQRDDVARERRPQDAAHGAWSPAW